MKVLDNLDMNNNQILNSVLHTTVVDPPDEDGRKAGKMIYNSTEKKVKYSDGDTWYTLKSNNNPECPYCTYESELDSGNYTGTEILNEIFDYDGDGVLNIKNLLDDFKAKNGYNLYECVSPFTIIYKMCQTSSMTGNQQVTYSTDTRHLYGKVLGKRVQAVFNTSTGGAPSQIVNRYLISVEVPIFDNNDFCKSIVKGIVHLVVLKDGIQYSSSKPSLVTNTITYQN